VAGGTGGKASQGFRGVLGAKVLICKPGDPEAKGGIERLHLANTRRKRSLG
jgi:hypothetical protein